MHSRNYDPRLSYFAIQYKNGLNNVITTYAIPKNELMKISPMLLSIVDCDWGAKGVKEYLVQKHHAVKNDFYDEKTDLIYPGELKYDRETRRITKAVFYKDNLKNNPDKNFSANITFCDRPKIQFFKNHEIMRSRFRYDTPATFLTENPDPKFRANYDDMIQCFKNPADYLGMAPLELEHQAIILKL